MYVVHGTWFPEPAGEFVQDGTFRIWVETDAAVARRQDADSTRHPRHMLGPALEDFLTETLKVSLPPRVRASQRFTWEHVLLPSARVAPLPSYELLPYVDEDRAGEWELRPWKVCSYPLAYPIPELNGIHFLALSGAEGFQLGADFLFWWQYAQELKRLIVAEQYIPSLAYREVKEKTKKASTELYGGWEFCSGAYEQALRAYAACMPPVCRGGNAGKGPDLYTAESLLRHFSERTLYQVVMSTSGTAALDRQLEGTLLAQCFRSSQPFAKPFQPLSSETAERRYVQWATWREKLRAGQTEAAFTLCFRLEEPAEGGDTWEVRLLAASRRDPSFKVGLDEYWALDERGRVALESHLGTGFERHLLLALGYAARVYPKLWEGLETERPAAFSLSLDETYAFLKEYAWVLEDAGFTVIVPSWWTRQGRRRARVRVSTRSRSNGSAAARSFFSLDSVVDYDYHLSIDGKPLTMGEWQRLVEAKTPLVRFRGAWMEVNREELQEMLALWGKRHEEEPALTLLDLLRLAAEEEDLEWEHDEAIEDVLAALQEKCAPEPVQEPPNFHGVLREYQREGVAWLRYLESLRLNPCLADDMGLGKTIQVIAQLVAERNADPDVLPTLLIAPTSVLGNWRKEVERFAPHLRVLVHHGPARHREAKAFAAACAESDLVVTSFALARLDEKLLRSEQWQRVVVDEAQNIKNPAAAQTKAITKLASGSGNTVPHRLALTGTPVENRLRDLWSIFNFLNPGYLGKEAQFRRAFEVPIQRDNDTERSLALRRLVEPFILRRLKTDRRIIQDLPDKIEQKVYCNLTTEQASLYEAVVREVEEAIDDAEGMQRRGMILATLMKLKQICNHPAQFLHDGSQFTAERSHKLQRLTEMIEEVLAEGESVLVFTQFTEAGEALERHLRRTLHCDTYYLYGGTSAKKREEMVAAFQDADAPQAVFVLSVRAGGTGLTLTKANHVFHFDRWWNPSVEDQATDRAFRIGQSRNVFAHKFVALGTVEERIDAMIEEKKGLAASIVGADETWLTELDNAAFKDLIALRRSAILE